ncbi:MAG: TrmH family RNA methyltransferase, partial [Herbinix sp.]|nr:TrmH family RNA methyltransferase [Herbinix sp.]
MTNDEIGVPPHKKPWPTGPEYDLDLLENGDKRNVLDKYRYMTVEAIKADLDKTRASLHVAIENWQHDLNIGTIVRAANAFNVETVHVIGKRHWNRRGAMVTDRYLNIIHHESVAQFVEVMKSENREIIGMDILP